MCYMIINNATLLLPGRLGTPSTSSTSSSSAAIATIYRVAVIIFFCCSFAGFKSFKLYCLAVIHCFLQYGRRLLATAAAIAATSGLEDFIKIL